MRTILALTLALWACDDDTGGRAGGDDGGPTADAGRADATRPDGTPDGTPDGATDAALLDAGAGDATPRPDGGAPPLDAAPRPDAAPADGAPPADRGPEDAATDGAVDDVTPDAGEPTPVPPAGTAAAAALDDALYLAWLEAGELRSQRFRPDGTRGPLAVAPAAEATALLARTAGGVPWLVTDAATPSVRRLDRADPPRRLPLAGPFTLGALGDRLLVVGRGRSGPAWITVDDQGVFGQIIELTDIFPPVTDAVAVDDGAWLRFGSAGQCLALDAAGAAVGQFPCPAGPGRLVGDGRAIMGLTLGASPSLEAVFTGSRRAIGRDVESDLPPDGDRAVVVVGAGVDPARMGAELKVADGRPLRRSRATWPVFPWPDTRAALVVGDEAVLFEFGGPDGPQARRVPLEAEAGFEDLRPGPGCAPQLACGEDVDCDGLEGDGHCCHAPMAALGPLVIRVAPRQVLMADVERADAYRLAFRVGEDRWVGHLVHLVNQQATPIQGFDLQGAHEGRALVSAGGYTALIARDGAGAWSMFWHYGSGPVRAPAALGCTDVLDATTADHTVDLPAGVRNASVLVVCPDRLIKAYPEGDPDFPGGRANPTILLADLGLPALAWARATRVGPELIYLLMGLPDGGIRAFTYDALGERLDPQVLPAAVDGAHPVVQPNRLMHPRVRVTDAGAEVAEAGDGAWAAVVTTPTPTRIEVARAAAQIVVAAPAAAPGGGPGTGFWVVDARSPDRWSLEPSLIRAGDPTWLVSREVTEAPLVLVSPGAEAGTVRIEAHGVTCR